MCFKKLLKKDYSLIKREILYDFMILESKFKTIRGESRQISLHCKYDFVKDRDKYYSEEFYIYLNVEEVTDDVRDFVKRWGFEREDKLPEGLIHILGNYNMTVKAIKGFII